MNLFLVYKYYYNILLLLSAQKDYDTHTDRLLKIDNTFQIFA